MKKWLVGAAWAVGVCALGFFFYNWTTSNGRDHLREWATEEGLCDEEDDCRMGVARLSAVIISVDMGFTSRRQIEWCLGVDDWADARVQRGGWLKNIAIEAMYLPCPLSE